MSMQRMIGWICTAAAASRDDGLSCKNTQRQLHRFCAAHHAWLVTNSHYLPSMLLPECFLKSGLSRRQVTSWVHHVHSVCHINSCCLLMPCFICSPGYIWLTRCNSSCTRQRWCSVYPAMVMSCFSHFNQASHVTLCIA